MGELQNYLIINACYVIERNLLGVPFEGAYQINKNQALSIGDTLKVSFEINKEITIDKTADNLEYLTHEPLHLSLLELIHHSNKP
jgi:hypothetical protein